MRKLIQILIVYLTMVVIGGTANGETISENEMDVQYKKSEEAKRNKNWKLMIEIVKPLAQQGHVKSQARLGALYLAGVGIEKNQTKGLKWLRLAAKKGNAKAEENIGTAYHMGLGVAPNLKEAIKWYERSIVNGNKAVKEKLAKAELQIGADFWERYPGKKYGNISYDDWPEHKKEGLNWFKRSAKNGNEQAKQLLAKINPSLEEEKRRNARSIANIEKRSMEQMRIADQKYKAQEEAAFAAVEQRRLVEKKLRAEEKIIEQKKRIDEEKLRAEEKIIEQKKRIDEEKIRTEQGVINEEPMEKAEEDDYDFIDLIKNIFLITIGIFLFFFLEATDKLRKLSGGK
jgi:TPR repeat protein